MKPNELDGLLIESDATRDFSVDRSIYTDEKIFDLEMKHIFESTWIFLCLESQIPNSHDFSTVTIGRQPVLVVRNGEGRVNAFYNACAHKGNLLANTRFGTQKFFQCPYHAWTYDADGANISIKNKRVGDYSLPFESANHGLTPIAKVASYKGWVFGSLSPDVPSLEDHLGGAKVFIDLISDQSAEGIELVPGQVSYTFPGNWKMQIENCLDGYHLDTSHATFVQLTERRKARMGAAFKSGDISAMLDPKLRSGSFAFSGGHAAFFTQNPSPKNRPIYAKHDELVNRLGETKAKWVLEYGRNLTVFPSVQCTDNAVVGQFRVIRPIAVDKTEMQLYCWAPKGEAAGLRAERIQAYVDFFTVSGVGTPDDAAAYEACQQGYAAAEGARWQQGYSRGQGSVIQNGQSDIAKELGISPTTSSIGSLTLSDETLFQAAYREWHRLLKKGLQAATK